MKVIWLIILALLAVFLFKADSEHIEIHNSPAMIFKLTMIGDLSNSLDYQLTDQLNQSFINYDLVVQTQLNLHKLLVSIKIPESKSDNIANFRQNLILMNQAIANKFEHIEHFKSQNSLYKNALNSIRNFKINVQTEFQHNSIYEDLLELKTLLISYHLFKDKSSIIEINQKIASLKKKWRLLKNSYSALKLENAESIEIFLLNAAASILLAKQSEDLLLSITEINGSDISHLLLRDYSNFLNNLVQNSEHKDFISIILLFFSIIYISRLYLNIKLSQQLYKQTNIELQQLKQALDTDSIVSISDSKDKIIYTNQKFCDISQYSAEELLGNRHSVLSSHYHPKQFFREMWATIAVGNPWHGSIKNRAKDGSYYWVQSTIFPFTDASGKPYKYISIRTDITELKRMEQKIIDSRDHLQLEVDIQTRHLREAKQIADQANQAKTDFLANMTHEMRTPLHGVMSFSKLGLRKTGKASVEKISRYFDNIHLSGERLLGLIDNLLDISKLESGKMNFHFTDGDLNSLVELSLNEQDARLKELEIKVAFTPSEEFTVVMDSTRITQVITNLLSNSMKFTPPNATIMININKVFDVDAEKPMLKFTIYNPGEAIEKDELEMIFEKFMQSKTQQLGTTGGTGLGLAISKEYINAHHGNIWAENIQPKGVKFHFTLPLSSS